ncbi:unnamed protein product [Paramecium sonneborni]|uniref:Uncharacterized protein n=1 Tax=Paramecium sonneborni TaxID=65129 RepID=A0A8S1R9C1_9CILI|nr:unnamed protein product [Paramecium sonneborni]
MISSLKSKKNTFFFVREGRHNIPYQAAWQKKFPQNFLIQLWQKSHAFGGTMDSEIYLCFSWSGQHPNSWMCIYDIETWPGEEHQHGANEYGKRVRIFRLISSVFQERMTDTLPTKWRRGILQTMYKSKKGTSTNINPEKKKSLLYRFKLIFGNDFKIGGRRRMNVSINFIQFNFKINIKILFSQIKTLYFWLQKQIQFFFNKDKFLFYQFFLLSSSVGLRFGIQKMDYQIKLV